MHGGTCDCHKHVTSHNIHNARQRPSPAPTCVLQGLRAPSPTAAGALYGAVRATGLVTVSLEHFTCTNVQGAHGWACLLLQYQVRGGQGSWFR